MRRKKRLLAAFLGIVETKPEAVQIQL